MIVVINGEERQIKEGSGLSVLDLIIGSGLRPEATVVEKNKRIIGKADYANEQINHGDVIEVVRFVGGG
jgi:thiamine biosynthesis protein ThiS